MRTILLSMVSVVSLSLAVAACGGDDGGGGDTLTCAEYCDTIATNCTGTVQQYTDEATCLAACAAFPVGAEADTSGNTLGCRTYHAGAAAAGPDVHCVHAGPGGAGACGSNCDGFCAIALDSCPDAYASAGECATDCATFTDTEPYNVADTSGDSLACRLYHLTAATTTPDPHCGHIESVSPTCN
jgi:hypothetical protein